MLRRNDWRRRVLGPSLGAALAAGLVGIAAVGSAVAQDPAKLVDDRQAHMKQLGGSMKTIAGFVKEDSGTIQDVQKAAATIVQVYQKMDSLWPEGTAIGIGDSEAKAEIWTQTEKFAAAIDAGEVQAAEMVKVAAAGDKAAIGQQLGKVAGTCKACHEAYRKEKD